MLRILIRNIVSNWVGFAVQAAVTFFLTPFVLHTLGDARYGIWALVIGLTGYYGLLDLGFRSGITQYLTRYLAKRDFEAMNATASTAMLALASCGGLIVLVSGVLSWLAPAIFNLPAGAVTETRWCIVVVGISTALQFVFFPYSAVFAATQRYDMSNVIGVGTCLAGAAATFAALEGGYGLTGLCLANASGNLLGYLLRWHIAYRILPELRISVRFAARQHLWAITAFGLWSVLTQGAVQLKSYSSILIIGLFLPVAAVAPFSLAVGLLNQIDGVFRPLATVFFPAATHLDALGDTGGLRKMYLAGSKILLLLVLTCGTIGAVWAKDFYRLWVGPRMVEGGEYPSVAVLFVLLLVGAIITTSQRIGYQVLMACRKLKELSILLLCEAVVGLIASICLVFPFGLIGVAMGVMLPAVVFQGALLPALVCRFLAIPSMAYLRQVYMRPSIVGGLLCLFAVLLHNDLPFPGNWMVLFCHGLIAGGIALPLVVMIGLNGDERRRFVFQPLAHLGGRFWFRRPSDIPADAP